MEIALLYHDPLTIVHSHKARLVLCLEDLKNSIGLDNNFGKQCSSW